MEDILTLLKHGLRRLDPEGRLTPEPGAPEDLHGVSALFVVDLEMSGPNAQMHGVLDLAGVRASLAPKLPAE